jgi:hypothetical protein
MSRLRLAGALAALVALTAAPAAVAHQGNPNFRSTIDAVSPKVPGLKLQVLNFDDRLELDNTSGRTVVVRGYQNEPYARVLGDGTVQVNVRSPAYYLNDERTSSGKVPASADPAAAPQWKVVDRAGRFQWHDHRIHWMSTTVPSQVKDKSKRTKVFDWAVPMQVGGAKGAIRGTLFWQPPAGGGAPTGAIGGLVAVALLGLAAVVVVRRRRGGLEPVGAGRAEAW